MDAKEFVEKKLTKEGLCLFTKSYCPHCKNVIKAFRNCEDPETKQLWVSAEIVELENLENCVQIQDELEQRSGIRSVPQVFYNRKFIGDGTQTVSLIETGRLVAACLN